MEQFTRRNAVLGALGTGAVALAGCVSKSGDEADDSDTPDDDDDPGQGETDLDSSITRVESDCTSMAHGEAPVFLDDGAYIVQGTILSPTPCYEPVIDSRRFAEGILSLTVDVTAEDDSTCVECAGGLLYDATVSGPDPSEVDQVSVAHAGGEAHDTAATDIPGLPELVEAKITDSESRPRDSEEDGTAEVDKVDDSGETGTIRITGNIPTENPHYEAVLTEARVRTGTLRVAVDVESTLEDDQMGTLPLGAVEYTVSAEIAHPSSIDSVQIQHPNAGYGSSWASDRATAAPEAEGDTHSDNRSSDTAERR